MARLSNSSEMRSTQVVCILIVVVFLDVVSANLNDVIRNIPSDVGNTISNAWHSLVTAIKRPVKVRRLGKLKRRKTTTSRTVTPSTIDIFTYIPEELHKPPTSSPIKLILPVITGPEWRTTTWKKIMRNPIYRPKNSDHEIKKNWEAIHKTKVTEDPEQENKNFGNLFFI